MTRLTCSARAQVLVLTCACAGTSALIYGIDPNRTHVYPTCWLYQRTGIYCAGCGATRATFALLHGRVLEALHDNALLILALPFLAAQLLPYFLRAWRANAWPEITLTPGQLWPRAFLIFGLILLFMTLRNIPETPFTWLAPIPPLHPFPGLRA